MSFENMPGSSPWRVSRLGFAAAAVVCAMSTGASAAIIISSTGFEASETPSYTAGAQLATVAGWNGDGQDATGWQISSASIGGSAAESGSQYILASAPTAAVPTRFQYQDNPITNFSNGSVLTGTVGVKLATPASGTVNRSTLAGLQVYDAAVTDDAALYVFNDIQNLEANTAAAWYIFQGFQDGTGFIYTLTGAPVNTYFDLGIQIDYSSGIVTDFVNGVALPNTGTTTATDFHDLDMIVGRAASTAGGTADRAGFDNYSLVQSAAVPEPAVAMLAFASIGLVGRRRRDPSTSQRFLS